MALISDPKIIYLDEPTLGLDIIARRELWDIILDLKNSKTIILTTHYLEEAVALSDRLAIMTNGHIVTVGTSEEIINISGEKTFDDAFVKLTKEVIE
jgi:ABC-2 type transport system ATP-binding protein